MYYEGVDISHWDGFVDWKLVLPSGHCDFAIFRVCHGLKPDKCFYTNYNNYVLKGRPIGYYQCVYGTTLATIRKEANYFVAQMKNLKKPFCVFVDMESEAQKALSKSEVTKLINEWLAVVSKAGYRVGVYTNTSWYTYQMYPDKVNTEYWWIAHYGASSKVFKKKGLIWQYTSDGEIKGISHHFDFNKAKPEIEELWKE